MEEPNSTQFRTGDEGPEGVEPNKETGDSDRARVRDDEGAPREKKSSTINDDSSTVHGVLP